MNFYKAGVAHPKPTTLVFWSDILNGVGLALHHSAASLVICMLTCGIISPSREVIETIIPLVVQHWYVQLKLGTWATVILVSAYISVPYRFVLIKYTNNLAYVVIELIIEVYFEWTIFASYEAFYIQECWLCRQTAAVMLLAHWLFLIAAAFTLTEKPEESRDDGLPKTV